MILSVYFLTIFCQQSCIFFCLFSLGYLVLITHDSVISLFF